MNADEQAKATAIVEELSSDSGNPRAHELAPLVYDEMRRLARGYLSRESPGHSFQPTDLVNETYLRLVDQKRVNWRGKTHFFAVGARMMRRILVDRARTKKRLKRGGDWRRVTLTDSPDRRDLDVDELLELHDALEKLAMHDPRSAQIAEMRFFAGLTIREVATVLGISRSTVDADWAHARAWLKRRLSSSESQ